MKLAKVLCVVFLFTLGASDSWAGGPKNIVEFWANGQFADFRATLPDGLVGGIDPVTRKKLPGKIGYDNSYLGDITGESNDESLSSANFSLGDAKFGKYELLFFQKADQKSPKVQTIKVTARGDYYPEGMGKHKPKLKLEKAVKINLPVNETCKVEIDYELDPDAKAVTLGFSSPCLVK